MHLSNLTSTFFTYVIQPAVDECQKTEKRHSREMFYSHMKMKDIHYLIFSVVRVTVK